MKFSIFNFQFSNFSRRLKRLWGNRKTRRRLVLVAGFCLLFIIFCLLFIIRPGLRVYAVVKEAQPHVRSLKDAAILQDLQMASEELKALDEKVTAIGTNLKALSWVGAVPVIKNYYHDAKRLLAAADYGIETGQIIVEAVEPLADVLGFKTEKTAAVLDAEKKVQGLVKAMPQIVLRMDEIAAKFSLIRQELDQIEPNRYPRSFRGQPIRSLLADAKHSMGQIEESMPDIKELLTILPGALGDPQPKTYLVLFQNDKELRPTGGFLTAYALLTLRNGEIVSVSSDDMYHLDMAIPWHPAPPPVLARYLKVKKYWARDTNLSPDFKESVLEFEKFWDRAPNVPEIDGVIGMDTYVVKELLNVLGPVKLPDHEEEFTSENVVYQLELYANLLMKFQWERKDLLGRLMNAILEKAFHAPREQWKPLFTAGLKLAEEKHILLYLHNQQAQTLTEKYNLAGRIRDFEGDYLHVNDANFAGRKANWYVEEEVTKEVKIEEGKKIESVVSIDYENTGAYHAEWNTGYRDYVRIYVPKGSRLISSSGSLSPVETFEDLGKTVFAGYVACDPLQKASFVVKYELPEDIIEGEKYKLLIQKQPGTDGHRYVININGKKIEEFGLKTDREFDIDAQ